MRKRSKRRKYDAHIDKLYAREVATGGRRLARLVNMLARIEGISADEAGVQVRRAASRAGGKRCWER